MFRFAQHDRAFSKLSHYSPIPYIATTLDAATSCTVRQLSLDVGGIIVLYLVTQNIRFVGIGLIIAVSGYALKIAGALRERNAIAG